MKSVFKKLFKDKTAKPSAHPTPQTTPYQMIGGEQATRDLANRFYDIMQSDHEASQLLAIHQQPLIQIRHKFFEFLSGWLGGPALYEKKYGHPRLRARHLPFTVDNQMKQQWMYCMGKALDLEIDNPLLRAQLRQSFNQLATHMINTE
jgi:hemoglobin